MNTVKYTSENLRRAAAMVEAREKLEADIATIDQQVRAIIGEPVGPTETPVPRTDTVKPDGEAAPRVRRAVRRQGKTRAAIVGVLKKAGAKGISLKEICQKLQMTQSALNSWMHVTGRQTPQIKKIGRGLYAWKG